MSAERTFAFDMTGRQEQAAELEVVFGHARRRLDRHGGGVRTVTVKARFADFTTVTRAVSLPQPSTDPRALLGAASQALAAAVPDGQPIRLLGVGFSGLTDYDQLTLGLDEPPAPNDGAELSRNRKRRSRTCRLRCSPSMSMPGSMCTSPDSERAGSSRRPGPN